MTEDDVSRGLSELNMFSGKAYEPVPYPSCIESVIATLPTGEGEAGQLWKLNHYYERLDDWNEAHGVPKNPFAGRRPDPCSNSTIDGRIGREGTNLAASSPTFPHGSKGSWKPNVKGKAPPTGAEKPLGTRLEDLAPGVPSHGSPRLPLGSAR